MPSPPASVGARRPPRPPSASARNGFPGRWTGRRTTPSSRPPPAAGATSPAATVSPPGGAAGQRICPALLAGSGPDFEPAARAHGGQRQHPGVGPPETPAPPRWEWCGTLARCQVAAHQHLGGMLSIYYGGHRLGRYRPEKTPTAALQNGGKDGPENRQTPQTGVSRFSRWPWQPRPKHAIPSFPPPPRRRVVEVQVANRSPATKTGHFNLLPTGKNVAPRRRGIGQACFWRRTSGPYGPEPVLFK